MYRVRSDYSPRWWLSGSGAEPSGPAVASSGPEEPRLRPPIPILLRDGKQPDVEHLPAEWQEAGAFPDDGGRVFEMDLGPRRMLVYQPRKTETNQVRSLDLALYFPHPVSIRDIRLEADSLPWFGSVPQGDPVVLVGRDNAYAVRIRATHPDLRHYPVRFEDGGNRLRMVLHLVDFGRERALHDEDLYRYSALVTIEEKNLNNPLALEGFEHDLARQEVWDDFSGQTLRRVGFIGNGFKLTGSLDPRQEQWVDRLVVGA